MDVGCLGADGARRTGAGREDVRGMEPGETEIVARFRVTTSPRSDLGSVGGLPISPHAWKVHDPGRHRLFGRGLVRCHLMHAGELLTDPREIVGQIIDDANRRWGGGDDCAEFGTRPTEPRPAVRSSR